MYRTLVALLCLSLASAAPQEGNSDITYVKIKPVTSEESEIQHTLNRRESKIQNLQLKISSSIPEQNNQSELDSYSHSENETDNHQSERYTRNDDATTINYESGETTESAETSTTTEKHEDPIIPQTEEYESQTKRAPHPRFYSKLSYFQKPTNVDRSITPNLIERDSKRKFRSKCRCEKISNCPKLQISVPRCPNEYFMCCF